jgi:CubicO group peptidase (beta-lactamase class C family)
MRYLITFILLLGSLIGKSQNSISDEKSLKIDQYINHIMESQKIPGLALAITYNGKVIKKKNYGLASIEYKVPVTDSSAFWLASISKHFTATTIMQLYENGIIDIEDEIKKYLPDIPLNWDGITIKHLLTHTSGLPSSDTANYLGHRSARGSYSSDEIYENIKNDTLVFQPGEDFLYSDEGIFLLGYITQKVSGLSFNEYMQKKIFNPSNMQFAYLMNHFKIHPNQVTGYSIKNGEIIPDRNSYRLIDAEMRPAGGIYATIEDMINWENSMINNVLLKKESKDLMWKSHKLNNGSPTYYGFCWNTQVIDNKRIIYHPGVAGTEYMRFVEDSISIIILTNQAKYERAISQKVAEIIGISPNYTEKDIKTGIVSNQKPNKEEIELLVGEYEFIPNENYYLENKILMDIIEKDNELWIDYPAKDIYRKKRKLGKLDNGRWIKISWEPTFVETSFEVINSKDDVSIKVFEDYDLGYEMHVGEMRKVN